MSKERLSAFERMTQQAMGADRTIGRSDDPFASRYPLLWEWLSRIYVGIDQMKQPATITIMLGPDGSVATLTDRDYGCSMTVATGTVDDLFPALEKALGLPSCPMRNWGKKEPATRRRPPRSKNT